MAIKQPSLVSPPALLCDWAEFKALSTPAGLFRLDLLKRLWDVNREREESDPEGFTEREEDTDDEGVSGGDDEAFIDSITGEIGERSEALGDSYPFRIGRGNRLEVVGPPHEGGYVYLFCLLLTYSNAKEILDGSWVPEVDNRVRDLFQATSTLAAAGEVSGSAISFGWPRPNGNPPFLRRLKEVYALFGEGDVVADARPGVSPWAKDEEIDVIAWRPRPDRAPGVAQYLLGQVASGDNWMSKPLQGAPIQNFHRNWFTQPPASQAQGYIFIPHAVPPTDSHGTRKERMNALTVRYGTIIDRMRLPALTKEGLSLARRRSRLLIERADDVHEMQQWVNSQLAALHRAAA